MAYNLAHIRQLVKDRLTDQNFSSALIDQFINDEQREICNYYDLPFNRESATLTLLDGESRVGLPSNHQKTKVLRITSPVDYSNDITRFYLPYNKFRRVFYDITQYSESHPRWWTIYDGTSIVFSWPADRNTTLQIEYTSSIPALEDDADVPVIPEDFQELLVLGALVRCYEANDDNDIAQYQAGKKNLLLQAMLKRYSPQQSGKVEILSNSNRGI